MNKYTIRYVDEIFAESEREAIDDFLNVMKNMDIEEMKNFIKITSVEDES